MYLSSNHVKEINGAILDLVIWDRVLHEALYTTPYNHAEFEQAKGWYNEAVDILRKYGIRGPCKHGSAGREGE